MLRAGGSPCLSDLDIEGCKIPSIREFKKALQSSLSRSTIDSSFPCCIHTTSEPVKLVSDRISVKQEVLQNFSFSVFFSFRKFGFCNFRTVNYVLPFIGMLSYLKAYYVCYILGLLFGIGVSIRL